MQAAQRRHSFRNTHEFVLTVSPLRGSIFSCANCPWAYAHG
jgi:hypothetical protein